MLDRFVAFAPGRVNLVGEHTDYNAGLALPFAIEAGVTVTATAAASGIEAVALDAGESDRFDPGDVQPAEGWRAYLRGMVAELQADGLPVRPCRLEVSGTVPQGSGLSSSAALEVAVGLAVLAVAGVTDVDPLRLARICSRAEREWTGAETGLLDQLASLLGHPGRATRIDFSDLGTRPVPLALGDWQLATVDSGDTHSLAGGSGYADRRRECREACAALGVETLRDAPAGAADGLPAPLARRVRHVLSENDRVDAAVDALRARDLARLGTILDASHASLRDDYESSTEAVEATVARVKAAGAAGARMVGGGFGGHVLALFGPGAALPDDARPVAPGPGAGLR